ncbi:MAG: acyl-CoA thioesterase [Clostridia bacterium]|nr:acyl-CoA thioesterase [Clostridia bacterium]
MNEITADISIRYSEISANGFVHHTCYHDWYDQIQFDFLSKNGYSVTELNAKGINFMPIDCMNHYYHPIRITDHVKVIMKIRSLTNIKINAEFTIFANDVKAADCRMTYACLNKDMKPLVISKACPDIYNTLKGFTD